jgi:hypothetical protein
MGVASCRQMARPSPVLPCRRRVGLGEVLKDILQSLGGNPQAAPRHRDAHHHFTPVGELDRVVHRPQTEALPPMTILPVAGLDP